MSKVTLHSHYTVSVEPPCSDQYLPPGTTIVWLGDGAVAKDGVRRIPSAQCWFPSEGLLDIRNLRMDHVFAYGTPDKETALRELARLHVDNLVDIYLLHLGSMCAAQDAPEDLVLSLWKKHHARDCYKRKIDPGTGEPMTRKRLEALAWEAKHSDFKGAGCILVFREGQGTCSVPLTQCTDEELYRGLY